MSQKTAVGQRSEDRAAVIVPHSFTCQSVAYLPAWWNHMALEKRAPATRPACQPCDRCGTVAQVQRQNNRRTPAAHLLQGIQGRRGAITMACHCSLSSSDRRVLENLNSPEPLPFAARFNTGMSESVMLACSTLGSGKPHLERPPIEVNVFEYAVSNAFHPTQ